MKSNYVYSRHISDSMGKYGWIAIDKNNCVSVHLFGVSVPAEIIPCADMISAMEKFAELFAKYDHK